MKNIRFALVTLFCLSILTMLVAGQAISDNKYVGVKACAPCHKAEKGGNQFGVWQKSKHAEAFNTLKTPKADEIAKAKGLKKSAAESPECVQCHTITGDAAMFEKTFDAKEGVQCESCHGAGSSFKSMATMKDKAKAMAAGLKMYKDDAAIEALCVTCHNDKSPTTKAFNFKEMWPKIKHAKKS